MPFNPIAENIQVKYVYDNKQVKSLPSQAYT